MAEDLYKTLGVSENADPDAIKKAYRKLARELHPDRNPDNPASEERFKNVQSAYGTLSDETKRRQYDRMRRFGPDSDPFRTRGGGNIHRNPDGTYVRMDGSGFDAGDGFGDIFERFFGGAVGTQGGDPSSTSQPRSRQNQSRSSAAAYDRKRTVRISFTRMLKGGKISFSLDGKKISVPFPKGIKDGHKMKVRSKGRPMPNGGAGDLLVTVRIEDHHEFYRDGLSVHANLEIPAFDAMLGVSTQVKTPHGKRLKLNIPAGSQSGEKFRIRGHGVETESKKGDLIVHLDVRIPDALTDEQRKLIKQARDAKEL